MTRDQAINELAKLAKSGDTEAAHCEADRVLCDLLNSLGYGDVVAAWSQIDKWYA